MLLKEFLPSPPLRDYIRKFCIVHFLFPEKESIPVKQYIPRSGDSIEFFLRDPEYILYPEESEKTKRPTAVIIGQHTLVINRYVGNDFLYLNITLQPGVLYRLTGIASYELTNTYIDAEAVFSKEILSINERLKNARSYAELISVAENYILKLISQTKKEAHGIDKVAKILLQDTKPVSMDWLAKETCLCARQFERKFKERMGVSASVFARIARFNKAVKLKNSQPDKDWMSIAFECSYYDYQHLVRDFKSFTHLTPTSFFQLEDKAPERILGLRE
jgi:AraC-like DNA-binding protein